MICRKCGRIIQKGTFCKFCGTDQLGQTGQNPQAKRKRIIALIFGVLLIGGLFSLIRKELFVDIAILAALSLVFYFCFRKIIDISWLLIIGIFLIIYGVMLIYAESSNADDNAVILLSSALPIAMVVIGRLIWDIKQNQKEDFTGTSIMLIGAAWLFFNYAIFFIQKALPIEYRMYRFEFVDYKWVFIFRKSITEIRVADGMESAFISLGLIFIVLSALIGYLRKE